MDNYVHSFIILLGIDKHKNLAGVLLKNEKDCQDFYENFFGRSRSLRIDLLKFRQKKLQESIMSFSEFAEYCKDRKIDKELLSDIFMQPITKSHFEIISKAISSGRTSLHEIYYLFCNNPNNNILKYVL